MKSEIVRGVVHLVPNKEGSIYEFGPDGWMVTLRQICCWFEDGVLQQDIREVKWTTDIATLRENSTAPGNIYQELTTEPIDPSDIEAYLWWQDGRVMRTPDGKAIYRRLYVDMGDKYQMYGELSKDLTDESSVH